MARLLAQQGKWPQAVEIYRHLLRFHPGEAAYRQALDEAERQAAATRTDRLAVLLPQWVRWTLALRSMRRLQAMRRRLRSPGGMQRPVA
jgi:hypothetical protein